MYPRKRDGIERTAKVSTVPRGSLEVIEYVARPALPEAVRVEPVSAFASFSSRLPLEHRFLRSFAAAFLVIALHALVVVPAVWQGGGSHRSQSHRIQGNSAMQWVVIVDSPGRLAAITPSSTPKLAAIDIGAATLTQRPIRLPVDASDSANSQADGESGYGEKYGRYLSQIRARIDRAWERPRSAIGAPLFQCQAEVDQDGTGEVQQVTLLDCNGGAAWKLSLVNAIQAASPLPPPSDRAVFVHHLLLEFRAMAYSLGQPAELYEPARAIPVGPSPERAAAASLNALQTLREAVRAPKSRVLKLQIEGSSVEVEPDRQ